MIVHNIILLYIVQHRSQQRLGSIISWAALLQLSVYSTTSCRLTRNIPAIFVEKFTQHGSSPAPAGAGVTG